MIQTWGWFWVVVKTKTTKGERAAGEERLERTSYYKGERADEVMNGCMRRMSRGEGSIRAKQHQLFTLLSNYILPHALTQR